MRNDSESIAAGGAAEAVRQKQPFGEAAMQDVSRHANRPGLTDNGSCDLGGSGDFQGEEQRMQPGDVTLQPQTGG